MKIFKNYQLKNYNTFGVKVIADSFAEINFAEDLNELLSSCVSSKIFILGGGSNILFKDPFLHTLVLKINIKGIKIIDENDDSVLIEVNAGEIWDDLVKFCVEGNYGGIENLSLIPGTVGAAPIQNIGAYGQELKEVFESLTAVKIDDGRKIYLTKDECKFDYRDSIFKRDLKNQVVITSVRLRLTKNPVPNKNYTNIIEELLKLGITNPTIKDLSNVIRKIRTEKLSDPVKIGNAGSFFKNPVVDLNTFERIKSEFPDLIGFKLEENKIKISAAWLIKKSGLKGLRIGNVGTYSKQPLVIVNYGDATGKEILSLTELIKQKVRQNFEVDLETEVNII